MEDETSRLLKLFDAAVTDFEAEMHKLEAIAGRLDADSDKEKLARLLKGASESCVDVNTRWLEVTEKSRFGKAFRSRRVVIQIEIDFSEIGFRDSPERRRHTDKPFIFIIRSIF